MVKTPEQKNIDDRQIWITEERMEENTIEEILSTKDDYDYIYISIGCKINEPTSNAPFQIFPGFVRDMVNQHKKVLIVLVDDFVNDHYDFNRTFINRIKHEYLTIKIINYYNYLTVSTVNESAYFIRSFTETCINLLDNNWMVCNYIQFKHPNMIELSFFQKMDEQITELMTMEKYKPYQKNIYFWYGYNIIFINMIVSFLEYKILRINYKKIYMILKEYNLVDHPIDIITLHQILEEANRKKMTVKIPELIDITYTNIPSYTISSVGGVKKRKSKKKTIKRNIHSKIKIKKRTRSQYK